MHSETIVYTVFLIFSGAALVSTVVLYTRQSLLVAYILLGILFGPWGLAFVKESELAQQIGEIGIIFLLFLLGLHLQPQNLINMLRKVTWVALISSAVFAAAGFAIAYMFGYTMTECYIIGAAMMFSSTIIGLKLLPTTILHHQHTGEVMISVLLMQDIIAIIVLIMLNGASTSGFGWGDMATLFLALPALIGFAFVIEKYVLVKLIARFDTTQEYIFLVSIGWCLGMAELAQSIGLSEEIGAFIGGVALAASPIAMYIAESLKPLRDFFLVMFFFAVGAGFNFSYVEAVLWPALIMSAVMLLVKPVLFSVLLRRIGESKSVSSEVGFRLGQGSEFSLLVVGIASANAMIGLQATYLVQAATIITFIASSYIVVLRYPTPIALSDKMRRD